MNDDRMLNTPTYFTQILRTRLERTGKKWRKPAQLVTS